MVLQGMRNVPREMLSLHLKTCKGQNKVENGPRSTSHSHLNHIVEVENAFMSPVERENQKTSRNTKGWLKPWNRTSNAINYSSKK
jgi:hypothetical protein